MKLTPEKRASAVFDNYPDLGSDAFYANIERLIAAAIRKAVEAEREACAKAVDSFNDIRDFTLLSDAIRARGNPTAEVK